MATDTGFGMVRFFDDFLDDTLHVAPWTAASANSGTAFAINVQVNGVVRGTVTNNSSNDLSVLYGSANYQADDGGPLIFEARCAIITSLSQLIFIGLSDDAATERPMDYNGSSLTTTAADAAGFYYAGGETSPTWRYGGTASNVDSTQTAAPSRLNPVLSTWQTFRVVVSADGYGSFYLNGELLKERVSGCLTVGTSVRPYLAITDDGAAGSLDCDYVFVQKGRV